MLLKELCFHLQWTPLMGNNSYCCYFLLAKGIFPISVAESVMGLNRSLFLIWLPKLLESYSKRPVLKVSCWRWHWHRGWQIFGVIEYFFNYKSQIGKVEEANSSPKPAMSSLRTMSHTQLSSFLYICKVCFLYIFILTRNILIHISTCPVPSLPQNLSNKKPLT